MELVLYGFPMVFSKEVWKLNFQQYGQMEKHSQEEAEAAMEKVRKQKMQLREKVGKSQNTVFFQ